MNMTSKKKPNRVQQIMFFRNALMTASAELKVERETVASQRQEIIELRVDAQKAKKRSEEDLEAANKGWMSLCDEKSKQEAASRKEASSSKARLDSMSAHMKLALKACQRGRRQKRKAKHLAQAQAMLEAAVEEDGILAWEGMPEAQKAMISSVVGYIGLTAAAMAGWFGKGK